MTHKVPIVKDRLPAIVELFQENGVSIRYEPGNKKNAQVCLTDVWKALGEDPSKRPNSWLSTQGACDYIAAVLEESQLQSQTAIEEHSDVLEGSQISELVSDRESSLQSAKDADLLIVLRGHKGGTFAHRKIALEYARYLNKRFAVRLDTKLEEAMERERDETIANLQGQIENLHQQVKEGVRLLREKNRQLFLPGIHLPVHHSTKNTIIAIIRGSSGPGVSLQRLYRMLQRETGFDVHAEQERILEMIPCSVKPSLITIIEGQRHFRHEGRLLIDVTLDLAIEMVDGVKREMRPLQLAASNSNVEVA